MSAMIRTLTGALGAIVAVVLFTGNALAVGDEPAASQQDATPRDAAAERYAEAVQLIDQLQFDSAIATLKQITRDDPGNADAWNWLGFASRKVDDFAASEDAYDIALTLDPDHKGALEYQGELRLQQDDLAAAEVNLAKLQRLCPTGCEERDDLERAIQAYKTTAENPTARRATGFY